MGDEAAVERHLPLRPVEFQILVGLGRGPTHGYALLQAARERAGAVVPGLATLYRALQRLEHRGLLEQQPTEGEDPTDERRRAFRLTPLGRRVASAEARRLSDLVELARAGALLEGEGGS